MRNGNPTDKSKPPDLPPQPKRQKQALTPQERWYLRAFYILGKHLERPPTNNEFADYTHKSITACYQALRRLERRGHVERRGKARATKFYIVGDE